MIIYMATNLINGKSYIGQTINSLEQRKGEHIRRSSLNNDNLYFHNALRKRGADLFEWGMLDKCNTLDQLNRLEIFYIGFYDTFNCGYNLTIGGNNTLCSEKTRRKISEAQKGKRNPNYGKRGKETSMYGRKHSKEARKKISETLKGRDNHCRGRKFSGETLKKISGGNNHNAQGVIVEGKYFSTLRAAAKFLGVVQTTVANRVKRKVSGYNDVTTQFN